MFPWNLIAVSTCLRVIDDIRGQAALAAAEGASIGELVERALDPYERAYFWRQAHAALAERPGVELEDHEAYHRAVRDGLDRG